MNLYRIRNWGTIYENNRTRELRKLSWVPIPNNHDGDGYTLLISRPNGPALLGAWIACVQVASKCDPRGTLVRRCGNPHDSASLSRITRIPEKLFSELFLVATSDCKWLSVEHVKQIPQEGAAIPQEGEIALTGMEQKGIEGKEGSTQPPKTALRPDHQAFIQGWTENFRASHGFDFKMAEGAREGKAVKQLLSLGILRIDLLEIAKRAWAHPEAGWHCKNSTLTIHAFAQHLNEIQHELKNGSKTTQPNPRNAGTYASGTDWAAASKRKELPRTDGGS